ncbi:Glycosyltransferase [Caenorhabditis elegans]|uniref:Glycosyltransferase n=1 Tax=Caenorhabditis elegans TaxID=6239 RepID=O17744_CAEEL|nr:Glycosyltransferase [Caenorhabditis elegans]CAB04026.3 Glycosyltransferase [Caenorhabditis elegans]
MNKLFIKYLIFLTVFGVLLVLFLIFKLHESTITSPVISYTPNPRFVAAIKSIGFPPIKAGNRWIVVTSVSHPTEDVKRLAAIEDWNLVVVADTKTPVDWWLENVHFLSVEYQKQLPFSLVTKLPYKSYTRKNIGYLYAISKGAEWIYDTDDDNKPYGLGLKQFDYEDQVSGARFLPQDARELSQRIFNPYRFYGMDGMWPRGFPLEHFEKHTNGNSSQVLCYKMERAAVQQGLVQHDPDVDAIYRLLNADKNSGLNVEFNKFAPPITLSVGTYSPWNSQNTLFHKSAFHTMFLPTTVSFRTTDIWRSFISQKILHLSGLTVSFVPTNAIQFRNAHDYLKDFRDEKRVYEDSGKMIDFFHNWKCDSKTLEDCIHKLLYDLVTADFWLRDDAEMMEMYLDDLKNLGFQFSKLLDYANSPNYSPSQDETTRNVNCRRMHLEFDLLKSKKEEDFSIRKAEQKLKYFGDIVNWCKETGYSDLPNTFPIATQLAKEHDDTYVFQKDLNSVLIAVNNYPWQYGMGLIQRLYQPYFATIIFCGSWYPEKIETVDNMTSVLHPINYIHMNPSEISYGAYAYHCVTLVKEMRLNNVQGYFMMSDDAVFNIWQRVDYSRVHHLTGSLNIYNTYFTGIYGEPAAKKILATVKDSTDLKVLETWKKFDDGLKKYAYNNITDGAEAVLLSTYGKSYSDFYYIPSTEIDYYADLMRLFYDGGLFLETAVDRFIRSINHQTSLAGESSYLWFDDREKWPKLYNKNLVALHPVKPSMFRYPGDARKTYCATVIQSWADIVFDGSRNFTIKDDGAKENYTII